MDASWLSSKRGARVLTAPRTVHLPEDGTCRLPPGRRGVVLEIARGSLLVTQSGDPEDHVLGPGDVLVVPRGGLAVAWALTAARFTVRDAAAPVADPEAEALAPAGA